MLYMLYHLLPDSDIGSGNSQEVILAIRCDFTVQGGKSSLSPSLVPAGPDVIGALASSLPNWKCTFTYGNYIIHL